jgi:GST-like protein
VSPNGKIPVIVDPDGPGGGPITVFESNAILQYLGRKSGCLYPQDERRWATRRGTRVPSARPCRC